MAKFRLVKKKSEPTHNYKIVLQVFEDGEMIAQHGSGEVQGKRFSDVISILDSRVRDKWTEIKQMAHVANKEQE